MKTVEKAYKTLWNLIDREEIHLHTLDFAAVCDRLNVRREELDSLLVEELGYTGSELLLALRQRHFKN